MHIPNIYLVARVFMTHNNWYCPIEIYIECARVASHRAASAIAWIET